MQQNAQALPDSRDVIKAAIRLAGGPEAVAAHFGLGHKAVRAWQDRGTLPARYVRQLSEKGGGVISVDALLQAIERTAADKMDA
ncbi:MAG: YdaS family helix-turn-helix protein [Steroidobacteraceae bacterium]